MPTTAKKVESRRSRQNRARRARQQALSRLAKDLTGLSTSSVASGSASWADSMEDKHRVRLMPGFTVTDCAVEPRLTHSVGKGYATGERKLVLPGELADNPNLRINRVFLQVVMEPSVESTVKLWCGLSDRPWATPTTATFPANAVRISNGMGSGNATYIFPGKTVEHLRLLRMMFYCSDYSAAGDGISVCVVRVMVEHEKLGQQEYVEL